MNTGTPPLPSPIAWCDAALLKALQDLASEDFEIVEQSFHVRGGATVTVSTRYKHSNCDVYATSALGAAQLVPVQLFARVGAQEEQVSTAGVFNADPLASGDPESGTSSSVSQRVACARSRACGTFRFQATVPASLTFVQDTVTVTMIAWGKQTSDERETHWVTGVNGTANADVIGTSNPNTGTAGPCRVASMLAWDARLGSAGGTVGQDWLFAKDKATPPINGDVCEPGCSWPLPGRPSFLTLQWAPSSRRFFKGFAWGISSTDPTVGVTLDGTASANVSIEVE